MAVRLVDFSDRKRANRTQKWVVYGGGGYKSGYARGMMCTKKECPARPTDCARLLVMLVGLHRLRISESVGAPKPSSSGGHGGVRLDSGRHSVAIILISRVLFSTDEEELRRIAQSRYGLVLLELMREVV